MLDFVMKQELGTRVIVPEKLTQFTTLYFLPNLDRYVLARVTHERGKFSTEIFESNREAGLGKRFFKKDLVTQEEAILEWINL